METLTDTLAKTGVKAPFCAGFTFEEAFPIKAIVMAGGNGTRLRPLTENCPKPMVKLLDKPVLEHIIDLLKKHDITEICVTLRYLPEEIKTYFGDGSRFGVSMTYRVETEPLGTAGGVKACADFTGGEDFLVISGDGVCDFDLRACIDFHYEKNAEVTMVLCSHPEPLEYGLVLTKADGRIERFIEKPAWDMVLTDKVNTGIYILSGRIMDEIPEGKNYDFSKDLFPALLGENRRMYGVCTPGYWCDIGSCESYHACCMDVVQGKTGLYTPEKPGLYVSGSAAAPVGSTGENVIFGSESTVEEGAFVEDAVVNGARIRAGARVTGAVLEHGADIGKGAVVHEGCVIGAGTVIGEGSVIAPGVKIWPGKEIPPYTKVTKNIMGAVEKAQVTFSENGTIPGEFNLTITPEICFALGAAASELGPVGADWNGEEAARILAEAFLGGANAGGRNTMAFDGRFEACAAFAGSYFGLSAVLFASDKKGKTQLTFFGKDGSPLSREAQRKLEKAVSGEFPRARGEEAGSNAALAGIGEAYAALAAHMANPGARLGRELRVAAPGKGAENRALRRALSLCGCDVVSRRAHEPAFEAVYGGFLLRGEDERGKPVAPEQMLVLTALAEFERGNGVVAVPYGAPAALDILAVSMGTKVLRTGRDGEEAARLLEKQVYMRDGVFAAAKICAALMEKGETLEEMCRRIPQFSSAVREVPVARDRGAVMHSLAGHFSETARELVSGLRVRLEKGWVHITPCHDTAALRIRAESQRMETAEELCAELEALAARCDREES